MDKLFVYAPTKAIFQEALENNKINQASIVFIENPREIWAQGIYYSCPYSKDEIDKIFEQINVRITVNEESLQQFIEAISGNVSEDYNSLEKIENKIKSIRSNSIIEITYNDLKNLVDTKSLQAGATYRIIDYVTSTSYNISANHPFDIVVKALDQSTLNEDVKVVLHYGDGYFKNSNLGSWEIKYSIYNNKLKYDWADETNGKGVIYYMKDEHRNECTYDFKNILFKRWYITSISSSYGHDIDRLNNLYLGKYYSMSSNKIMTGDITINADESMSMYCYTFNTASYEDATVVNTGSIINYSDNKIGIYDMAGESGVLSLPNVVFIPLTDVDSNSGNVFIESSNLTISSHLIQSNTFKYSRESLICDDISNNIITISNSILCSSVYNSTINNSSKDVFYDSITNSYINKSERNYFNKLNNCNIDNIEDSHIANMNYSSIESGVKYIDLYYNYSNEDLQYIHILRGTAFDILTVVPSDIKIGVTYPQSIGFNSSNQLIVKALLDDPDVLSAEEIENIINK